MQMTAVSEAVAQTFASIPATSPYLPVKIMAERYPEIVTEPSLRAQIHDAEDRVAANGQVVKGNGLAPAILRIKHPAKTRGKVLIHVERYFRWIETGSAA